MKKHGCLWKALVLALSFVALLGILVTGFLLFYCPPGPRPVCGRLISHAFEILTVKTYGQNASGAHPNVEGSSYKSLLLVHPYVDREPLADMYMYVPGLHEGDPDDLIMLYLKKRTRYRWHGDSTTVFRKPGWAIFNPDFTNHSDDPSLGFPAEMGYWIDTPTFKKRLGKTLDFLRENKRPNWEVVVKEHTAFLESME